MISKATDASIAALGGTCPGSDITARPVTATKAGPVALTFLGSVDRRMSGSEAGLRPATSISGWRRMVNRKIGNPHAEKAGACRSQTISQ